MEEIVQSNPNDNIEEQELYEHHHIVVDKGQALLRIDKYLQMHLEGISRTKIQAAAEAQCILVNGKPTKSNYRVKPLDEISVLLPEPPHEFEVLPEEIPFKIVYEDDDVLVIDKQPGLVVHPGYGNFTGTLLNGLMYYYQGKKDKEGNPITPYLVHRIDKDTSGLLLIAKNEAAQIALGKQFFDHTIERKYNALVWGDFDEENGTIDGNLIRSPKDRRIMTVVANDPDDPLQTEERGKRAITHWKVLERFGYVTLVECVLETGRTVHPAIEQGKNGTTNDNGTYEHSYPYEALLNVTATYRDTVENKEYVGNTQIKLQEGQVIEKVILMSPRQ